jgi:Tfp pilus assembly protein PilN
MKQRINLLPPVPKIEKNGLSLTSLLSLITLLIVMGLATTGYFWWQTNKIQSLIALQQKANTNTKLNIHELSSVVSQRKLPKSRENTAINLQQEIDAMNQMLEISDQLIYRNTTGYLDTVSLLHQNLPKKTILDELIIEGENHVSLIKGHTDIIADIPKFIELLRNRGVLHQHNITNMRTLQALGNYSFELQFSTQQEPQ